MTGLQSGTRPLPKKRKLEKAPSPPEVSAKSKNKKSGEPKKKKKKGKSDSPAVINVVTSSSSSGSSESEEEEEIETIFTEGARRTAQEATPSAAAAAASAVAPPPAGVGVATNSPLALKTEMNKVDVIVDGRRVIHHHQQIVHRYETISTTTSVVPRSGEHPQPVGKCFVWSWCCSEFGGRVRVPGFGVPNSPGRFVGPKTLKLRAPRCACP